MKWEVEERGNDWKQSHTQDVWFCLNTLGHIIDWQSNAEPMQEMDACSSCTGKITASKRWSQWLTCFICVIRSRKGKEKIRKEFQWLSYPSLRLNWKIKVAYMVCYFSNKPISANAIVVNYEVMKEEKEIRWAQGTFLPDVAFKFTYNLGVAFEFALKSALTEVVAGLTNGSTAACFHTPFKLGGIRIPLTSPHPLVWWRELWSALPEQTLIKLDVF